MTVTVMKKKIMDKLNKSNDEQLLSGIYDLLKDESKKEPLMLTSAQIRAIKIAENEIAEGKTITNAEVRRRAKVWLGK